ncbi:MAG TPA: SgcJ/EcaC family oxidoreductase [bacterium]|nr:SgcJ/EcaC family oxidoreductase [bacterium]
MDDNQAQVGEELALANFTKWADSLLTKDPKEVSKLYAPDATFLPTVSGEFKKGATGAAEYFEHFLAKNPVGKLTESATQVLGPTCYAHAGMYDFELGPDDNRQVTKARFTFIWRQDNGEWKIIHHHSSVRPA